MTKRYKKLLALLIAVLVFSILPTGCQAVDSGEGYGLIREGINASQNGVNGDIYYAKLTTVTYDDKGVKTTNIKNINVLAEEKDYEIVTDAAGNYVGLKAEITESVAIGNTEAKVVRKLRYGNYNGAKALKIIENNGEPCYVPMTDNELKTSEYTSAYSMKSLLWVTENLNKDDITFDFSKGGVSEKGKVTTVTFKVTEDYLKRFSEENGTPSPLDADYISIEVAYGRMQSVIAYKREPGFENFPDIIAIDYEKYKLEISYRGPKFDVNVDM